MKRLIAVMYGLWIVSTGIAQTEKYEFVDVKPINETEKVVYFYLSGISGEEHANAVLNSLENDLIVGNCWLFPAKDGSYQIKAYINQSTSPEYIRQILASQGADYDFSKGGIKVTKELNKQIEVKKRGDGMPEHYPIFVDTGNPKHDNSVYEQAKQEWFNKYPEEVSKVTGKSIEEIYGIKKSVDGAPVFVDTGNPDEDNKRYDETKKIWLEKQSGKKEISK